MSLPEMSIKDQQDSCPNCLQRLAFTREGESGTRRMTIEQELRGCRVKYYKCPLCRHRWNAYPEGHLLHDYVQEFINEYNLRWPADDGPTETTPRLVDLLMVKNGIRASA